MELTPILIRGKRHRKGESNAVLIARRLKRKRREEMKGVRSQKKSTQAITLKPRASYLEKELPLEILERIIWMSETVNLLRASPRIGRLFSGESTRRETLLQAFGPTWSAWYGFVLEDRQNDTVRVYGDSEETGDAPSGFPGCPSFQTELLECSWVDIDFILDSFEIWAKRHMRSRSAKRFRLWPVSSAPQPLSPSQGELVAANVAAVEENKSVRHYFEEDYRAFTNDPCRKWSLALGRIQAIDHRSYPTWIEVHPKTRIPDSLLTGPWDDAAQRKFFWLVRGGSGLQADQTWELTLEGFHKAVDVSGKSSGGRINLSTILLLFYIGAFSSWPKHLLLEESTRFANYRVGKHERTSAEDLATLRAILGASRSRHREPRRPLSRPGVTFELVQDAPFPHGVTG
jgi:hypothetical protein